uniref:Uncharacterized protein n=1 Tax=Cyprinodon variegatus TaxID=28743 RepID=A0A3Q2CWR9_CYPVA
MSAAIRLCTCFSTSRMVSSEWPSFAFFTWVTALERTFLRESLALLLNCLANLARFSLCSRVTLKKLQGTECVCVCDRLTSGKLLMLTIMSPRDISQLPGEVRMLRLRVNSSLSAPRTAVMSSFTSSKLMMSSTRAELIFTLADWPFALA